MLTIDNRITKRKKHCSTVELGHSWKRTHEWKLWSCHEHDFQEVSEDLSVCALNILPEVCTLPSLVARNLINVEIWFYQVVTWSRWGHITSRLKMDRLGNQKHCDMADLVILIYHVISRTTSLNGHVTYWIEFHHPRSPHC